MKKKIIFYGANSQYYICYNMINNKLVLENYLPKDMSLSSSFVVDDFKKKPHPKSEITFYNSKKDIQKAILKSDYFVNCIGSQYGKKRVDISKKLMNHNLKSISLINKTSIIEKNVKIGLGLIAMNGAIINIGCKIGDFVILNTACVIDHECEIDEGVHIMGGASIAGRVKIGKYATIGTNATILPDIVIGEGAYVGAGSVVTKNVSKNSVVIGNPAKKLSKLNRIKHIS